MTDPPKGGVFCGGLHTIRIRQASDSPQGGPSGPRLGPAHHQRSAGARMTAGVFTIDPELGSIRTPNGAIDLMTSWL